MKVMKAENYNCSFKGISTVEQQQENDNEFNHSDGVVAAFSSNLSVETTSLQGVEETEDF